MEKQLNYQTLGLIEEDGIWYGKKGNYWSNLSKEENSGYVQYLKNQDAFKVMKKFLES